MLLVLVEEVGVSGGHVEGGEEGVFVRERVPTEREDIEDEPLR
jgi:hypothetical protein